MSRSKSKHQEVYEQIHSWIIGGEYVLGRRIPTELELARQFNVARATVSKALRELEERGLLVRRRGAGSFVSEAPNQTGQLLGIIVAKDPERFTIITNGITRLAQENGLGILLGRQPSGSLKEIQAGVESLCEQYIEQEVAGVFFAPMELPRGCGELNARVAETFDRHRIPLVLLDSDISDFPQRSSYDLVSLDHLNTGYVATEHLLKLGYQRIGYLRYDQEAPSVAARLAGYREALSVHGIKLNPVWISQGDVTRTEFVRAYLDRAKPEAIVCVNDNEAAKLMRTLAKLAVRVPQDLAITGVDDDKWATYLSVALTTMSQPSPDLAAAAMKLMLDRIKNPFLPAREVSIAGRLIVRASSGAHLPPDFRRSEASRVNASATG